MDTLTLTDLRKRFKEVLTLVEQGKTFVVTKHGKPVVLLTQATETTETTHAV